MASDKLTSGNYSRVLPLPFFTSVLSENASPELLLVLASVSQFDSSHPWTINGKSCRDLMLATLNFNSLLHWSSFTKTTPVKIRDECQIVRSLYLKGLFAFSYVLGAAEEKKKKKKSITVLCKVQHQEFPWTYNPLHLYLTLSLNLPNSLLPILKLSPYYAPQLQQLRAFCLKRK